MWNESIDRERKERLEHLAQCPHGHDIRHFDGWLYEIEQLYKENERIGMALLSASEECERWREEYQKCFATANAATKEPELTVTLKPGVDVFGIEFVQMFEKHLDHAFLRVGFSRTATSKNENSVQLNYKQIAVLM